MTAMWHAIQMHLYGLEKGWRDWRRERHGERRKLIEKQIVTALLSGGDLTAGQLCDMTGYKWAKLRDAIENLRLRRIIVIRPETFPFPHQTPRTLYCLEIGVWRP